jgi:hypothetical protein
MAVADLQQLLEQTSAALVSSQAAVKEARAAAGRRRLKDAAAAAAAAVTHGFGATSTAVDISNGQEELQQLKVSMGSAVAWIFVLLFQNCSVWHVSPGFWGQVGLSLHFASCT